MKKVILPFLCLFLSFPSYSAVGWFYHDEIAAIKKALDSNPGDKYRGSSLNSIEKISTGFKVNLSGGCTIFLNKAMVKVAFGTGANVPVILKIDERKSGCK